MRTLADRSSHLLPEREKAVGFSCLPHQLSFSVATAPDQHGACTPA